ncbi:23S rRNA (uridine(2552)-2'-O)-methyltransferase [Candidatus Schneideria nysicola]|uniref:RlmE family RNA methyltransferase n=1 Tax=Candidatus Schneideria nysicola TaxID=1081631 RepID=UPI001CAA682C|nr:SAM-dependent methyltransferase [Candidatus Schneideria nysicola]UAJ64904.1 23S rRNA (uridine(2552)-2'-O)-methyltransferase [Candidatus Schneideria nysicola]
MNKVWLRQHFKDIYIKQKYKRKIRSRAWFKLDQIQKTDNIFNKGMHIIDLGSAPGGWSEYALKKVIPYKGSVIACDILPMQPLQGVEFIQVDCFHNDFLKILLKKINNRKIKMVMSDMSPNITGISSIDIPNSINYANITLNICYSLLEKEGNLLLKIFQGEGFNEYIKKVKLIFNKVIIRKPPASRSSSREVYLVAKGFKR